MIVSKRTCTCLVASLALTGGAAGQLCGEWNLKPMPVFEGQPVYPLFIQPLAPDHAIGVQDVQTQSGEEGVLRAEWDGTDWTVLGVDPLDLPQAWDVRAMFATSPADIWVAGLMVYNNWNGRPFLAHWDGQDWESFVGNMPDDPNPQAGDPIRSGEGSAIVYNAPDDIWVIGAGEDLEQAGSNPVALHFDGSNLDEFGPLDLIFTRLSNTEGADGSTPDDAWIVGNGRNSGSSFQLFTYHWDGTDWTQILQWTELPGQNVVQSFLYDVISFAPDDAWAVGNKTVQFPDFSSESQSLYLHWDGSGWTEIAAPNIGPLSSIAGSGPNDIWTTCPYGEYGGRMAHYDGVSWTELPSAPVPPQATHIGLNWLSSGPTCDNVWMLGYWAVYDGAGGWEEFNNVFEQFAPAASSSCEGDVDANGIVDVNDIAFVIFRLGVSGTAGTVEGDADINGIVDINDVAFVVFRIGAGCL